MSKGIKVKFKLMEKEDYTILHLELEENIAPEVLKEIEPPKVNTTKGVILSGRAPIWLYCFLTHCYHPTKFVATYDPRLGGAVVVETHCLDYKVGEVIELDLNEL